MLERDTIFINGEFVAPSTDNRIEVISPHTEQVIGYAPDGSTEDMDRAVAAAREAFDNGPWARMTPAERGEVLATYTQLLMARAPEVAQVITQEMGSPITFSTVAQAYAAFGTVDYYTKLLADFEFEAVRDGLMNRLLIQKKPVGVVAAIVPWNTPLFTTTSKVAPALAAGCSIVLKPAPESPCSAYVLAEAANEAGIPPGVLNIVPAGRESGDHLVRHPDVDKVGFTGSPGAGRAIMAGASTHLAPVTLELGGKSASIILEDADLDVAIPTILGSGLMNSGQACVAQTRILVHESIHDEVVTRLVEAMQALKVGDPMDPETNVGPMVAERQRERVEKYIALGQEEGAKIATGGGRPAGLDTGWYVEPTLFVDVDNSMRIAQEEIFGPVLVVIKFRDTEEAIQMSNDSDYGLSGTVWSADPNTGLEVSRRIRTGSFGINAFGLDFGGPFGGFKNSGIGREFGPEGLEAYLVTTTVHLPAGFEPELA